MPDFDMKHISSSSTFFRIFFISLLAISLFLIYTRYIHLSRKPNLIIISIDALRQDHMGIYGYGKNTTPNIDAWAKNADVFTNTDTLIPLTYPSFTILMTGKPPSETGIWKNPADDNSTPLIAPAQETLAGLLNKNGYQTAAFVSNMYLSSELTGMNKGFNLYRSFTNLKNQSRDGYEEFINSAINWMTDNKNNQFFLWIHLINPHAPYDPPDDLRCVFGSKYCDTIQNEGLDELEKYRVYMEGFNQCLNLQIPAETVGMYEALYDGSIAYSDILFKKIITSIDRSGLADKSVIMLYGDHGEGFDHDYNFTHGGVLYDSSVKIPLIIRYPRPLKVNKINNLTDNTDILPTLLDLLKIDRLSLNLPGRSLAEIILGKQDAGSLGDKSYVHLVNDEVNKFGVVHNGYKYIYSINDACLNSGQSEELYDLKKDPEEKNNLVLTRKDIVSILKPEILGHMGLYPITEINQDIKNNDRPGSSIDNLKSFRY